MALTFKEFDGRWKHKDEWKQTGDGFLIVVSRHWKVSMKIHEDGLVNGWCVYAYIYPSHPLFKAACESSAYEEPLIDLPFHGGITKKELHFNDNHEVTAVQLGADYSHLGDEHYERYGTKLEAWPVFCGAFQLFNRLNER
jgi:hypothetical protein